MRPAAALFDVDGTLIDSVDAHARAWAATFARYGVEVSADAVHDQIGKGGDRLMPVFLPQAMIDARGEEIEAARKALFRRDYLPSVVAVPGARALLQRLRDDGVRVALASSCKADELDDYVEIAGVGGLFEVATTSDDAESSKPAPDIFQAALDRLGVDAIDAAAVGDSPWDAKAAGAAGLPTVGVLSGGFRHDTLRDAGVAEVWRDCADLLANLDRSLLGRRDDG